jgi:dienelactone hydrolase
MLKLFFIIVISIIGLIALTLTGFWVEMHHDITLPVPTGNYSVGRSNYYWVDSSRTDSLSPKPYTERELVIWVWFPVNKTNSENVLSYDRADWKKDSVEEEGFSLFSFFRRESTKIHPHSIQNAKLSDEQSKYPILLMKSGIGTFATDYSVFAEDLASHGYIVVGTDSPYSTYMVETPDGRVIRKNSEGNPGETESQSEQRERILNRLAGIWSDDARFVLNKLEQINSTDTASMFYGRLDFLSVGIFGHSFGGAVSAQFCFDDPRCKAGVDLDGAPYGNVIQKGPNKPFMFLLADHSDETDSVSLGIKSNIKKIYNTLPESRIWYYIQGTKHFNFSDKVFQFEVLVSRFFGFTGSIGGRNGLEIISACLRFFFDVHLKGEPDWLIRKLPDKYPEIKFGEY